MYSVRGWYRDKGRYQCRNVQSHSLESLIWRKLLKVRMILQCWQLLRLYSIKSGWIQWVWIIGWMIMIGKERSTYRKPHLIANLSSERTAPQCTKVDTIFFCELAKPWQTNLWIGQACCTHILGNTMKINNISTAKNHLEILTYSRDSITSLWDPTQEEHNKHIKKLVSLLHVLAYHRCHNHGVHYWADSLMMAPITCQNM